MRILVPSVDEIKKFVDEIIKSNGECYNLEIMFKVRVISLDPDVVTTRTLPKTLPFTKLVSIKDIIEIVNEGSFKIYTLEDPLMYEKIFFCMIFIEKKYDKEDDENFQIVKKIIQNLCNKKLNVELANILNANNKDIYNPFFDKDIIGQCNNILKSNNKNNHDFVNYTLEYYEKIKKNNNIQQHSNDIDNVLNNIYNRNFASNRVQEPPVSLRDFIIRKENKEIKRNKKYAKYLESLGFKPEKLNGLTDIYLPFVDEEYINDSLFC